MHIDNRIELRHLRYFVAVAEELHFGRAARRLNMAQPPLSQQIRQLEGILGHALFERTSRAVRLTAAGEAFLERARRTLRNMAEDLEEARSVGRGESGFLRVGFVGSCMLTGVPAVLGEYRERFPRVRLHLHESFTALLTAALIRGELDAAFLRDPDDAAGLEYEPIFDEPFVAAVPRNHPAAGERSVTGAELRNDVFVLFPAIAGKRAHARTAAIWESHGYQPRAVQEAPQWLTILRLVGAGLGVTIAPACVRAIAGPEVMCIPLSGTTARSEIVVAYRRNDDRALVQTLIAVARERLTPRAAPRAAGDSARRASSTIPQSS